ncbi:hypothetical protein [Enterobacter hormaechei]
MGLPAIFQFGGLKRNDPLKRLLLEHGDVFDQPLRSWRETVAASG